ncbi:SIR2 family protein [Candidatus Poribacteria bacterium]|nr:SIR2 family protein [Candidatus Poribacteria bacterium]
MKPDEIENTQAVKELVAQIKKGNCILFLGAGVHAPPPEDSPYVYPEEQRLPLGRVLAEKLADGCDYKQKFPKESYLDLQRVSLCFETTPGLGRSKLVDYLTNHLRTGKKPSPALVMLAGLPFKIFVTTNYDLLLESALRKFDKDPAIFVYNPRSDEPTPDMEEDPTAERPLIFKMHGDLNQRDSIVITDEDYITFIQRMSDKDILHPVPQTVRYRMQKWPTLFVGYSLRDYNLRLLFRTLHWHVDPANIQPSFSVDRNPDPLLLQVWQNERRLITFVTQDLWTFVPWLFKEIKGKEYQHE